MAQLKRTGHLGMSEADRLARMSSIGGSDARIIMSGDQRAIERLWLEKRGETEAEDLSEVLIVQMGNITEPLNQDWFELQTGYVVTDEQRKVFYKDWEHAHSTLDGLVRETVDGPALGVLEAKFMFPFGFEIEKAIEKYQPQVQHNMMVNGLNRSWLSIITGAAQWYVTEIEADFFYQASLLEAEQEFWDCVKTGKTPGTPEVQVPLAERIRIVDMSTSNEWATLASTILQTKNAFDAHDKAKKAIGKLFPADAGQASGHGVTIKLSKDGKKNFTLDKTKIIEAETEAKAKLLNELEAMKAA